jgi:DHA2 family methylenomycin A resistance protein-like MFS transporter
VTTAIGFLVSLTMFGLVFLLSLYFQRVLSYSPSQAGLAFVPFALMVTVANLVGGRIAARAGARRVLVLGLLVAAVGYVLLRGIDENTSYGSMLPAQLMIRAGIGIAVPALTTALLASVDRTHSGIASGVLNGFREAGGALGVSLFGAFMVEGAVAGIQLAINVSALLLVGAAGLAIAGIRRDRDAATPAERPG